MTPKDNLLIHVYCNSVYSLIPQTIDTLLYYGMDVHLMIGVRTPDYIQCLPSFNIFVVWLHIGIFKHFLKQLYFRNDRRRESTFFIFAMFSGVSSYQQWLHSGHFRLLCLILCNMLCKIDAIGVTPIPAPIKIACSVFRASLDDVPNGPSRKH